MVNERDSFERLWGSSIKDLASRLDANSSGHEAAVAERILRAKALIAQERTARWTMCLVFATFLLALVSAGLAIWG